MQTFLPHPSFTQSAVALDDKRLNKQILEGYQILRTLLGESKGWQYHPAVKMWRGYEKMLCWYIFHMHCEWELRGHKHSCNQKAQQLYFDKRGVTEVMIGPPWLGNEEFHASHRSNLLRKDPVHYGQFGWSEPSDLPYIWPV